MWAGSARRWTTTTRGSQSALGAALLPPAAGAGEPGRLVEEGIGRVSGPHIPPARPFAGSREKRYRSVNAGTRGPTPIAQPNQRDSVPSDRPRVGIVGYCVVEGQSDITHRQHKWTPPSSGVAHGNHQRTAQGMGRQALYQADRTLGREGNRKNCHGNHLAWCPFRRSPQRGWKARRAQH
jgi:hypothetical protein